MDANLSHRFKASVFFEWSRAILVAVRRMGIDGESLSPNPRSTPTYLIMFDYQWCALLNTPVLNYSIRYTGYWFRLGVKTIEIPTP